MTLLGKKSNEKIMKVSAAGGVNDVPLIVPFYKLLPYQDLILNVTKVLSFRNPIGLRYLITYTPIYTLITYIILFQYTFIKFINIFSWILYYCPFFRHECVTNRVNNLYILI